MDTQRFVAELGKLRPSATFLSLLGYRNSYGEVADYSIVFHIGYENALMRSISYLQTVDTPDDLSRLARMELIDGYKKSLTKMALTPVEEIEDAYTRFFDEDGRHIKGVKLHTETSTLHLYGLLNSKRISIPGQYPNRNKRPLTIAKDKLRKGCPVEKFRQFRITPYEVDLIRVERLELLPPE